MKFVTQFLLSLAVPSLVGCASTHESPSASGKMRVLINKDKNGVALQGYDPVAYFKQNMPVKGSSGYTGKYDGAIYYFSSEENQKDFEIDPMKYAPAFGGYCGYAASINRLSPIRVEYFQILDGRLVLQHNQRAYDKWNADLSGNIVKADMNWPGLVSRHGKGEKVLVNVDDPGVALEGHDPVGYFDGGRPLKGNPEIMATYNGAMYHFVSQENREVFERDPTRYEPQFGGYCGYAASINKVSPVNINIFQIINDRLVLQHTQKAYDLFNKNPQASLSKADMNWPDLVECHGK